MSNFLYPVVGVEYPSTLAVSKAAGCTIVPVTGHASNDYEQGDVMVLSPSGFNWAGWDEFVIDAIDSYVVAAPAATGAASATTVNQQCRLHGVLLDDLAAGATGLAVVRGHCLAKCDIATTTISKNQNMYVGGSGDITALGNLTDLTATHFARIIASFRGLTGLTAAAGTVLRPVLFNGVEGFGTYER